MLDCGLRERDGDYASGVLDPSHRNGVITIVGIGSFFSGISIVPEEGLRVVGRRGAVDSGAGAISTRSHALGDERVERALEVAAWLPGAALCLPSAESIVEIQRNATVEVRC